MGSDECLDATHQSVHLDFNLKGMCGRNFKRSAIFGRLSSEEDEVVEASEEGGDGTLLTVLDSVRWCLFTCKIGDSRIEISGMKGRGLGWLLGWRHLDLGWKGCEIEVGKRREIV
jgi:hypothetical protein